jgi:hypothetical protein
VITIAATSLTQLIKKIAEDARKAAKPCTIVIGTVLKTDSPKIKVNQKLILTDEFLYFTETASKSKLKKGDKVVMIRADGGQKYLVVDRMV